MILNLSILLVSFYLYKVLLLVVGRNFFFFYFKSVSFLVRIPIKHYPTSKFYGKLQNSEYY